MFSVVLSLDRPGRVNQPLPCSTSQGSPGAASKFSGQDPPGIPACWRLASTARHFPGIISQTSRPVQHMHRCWYA
ncbi:unnamed protein product [Fusarium venenatum]|uniref:Uncharacterized protein n=1 Tax=Fusarium venenatum TaxID=56646 RepID=A0A2L2TNT8_9HYPO|nr:uncharacterized protein FVRRES_05471 [Fusarium venenatum]CEI61035.1 unnamed protein product [Fusarium venenatum]